MSREMEFLDGFVFDVKNMSTGVVVRVLTVEGAAEICGNDVTDLGSALEWYSVVGVPTSFEPDFEVSRIEIPRCPC